MKTHTGCQRDDDREGMGLITRTAEPGVLRLTGALVLFLTVSGCGDSPSTPSAVPFTQPAAATSPSTAPPALTSLASGVVVDTDGRPIAGARLTVEPPSVGQNTQTDASGAFAFSYSPAPVNRVAVTATDHEPGGIAWRGSADPVVLHAVLQRTILVGPGGRATVTLTNGDLPQYVGEAYESDYCSPCRIIRIVDVPNATNVRVTLRWTGDEDLQMWASGMKAVADGDRSQSIRVGPSALIYVGLTLGADLRPRQLTRPVTVEIHVE